MIQPPPASERKHCSQNPMLNLEYTPNMKMEELIQINLHTLIPCDGNSQEQTNRNFRLEDKPEQGPNMREARDREVRHQPPALLPPTTERRDCSVCLSPPLKRWACSRERFCIVSRALHQSLGPQVGRKWSEKQIPVEQQRLWRRKQEGENNLLPYS